MSGVTPGPLPTKHIFLHEIAKQKAGSKVRFLGCLASYDVSTGLLVLEHAFPSDAPHVPCVKVDITLVLESIESEMLQPGTWLNIIGYIDRSALRKNRVLGSELTWGQTERGSVQALVVWSAGALRIGDYERILMQQHGMTKESQMTT